MRVQEILKQYPEAALDKISADKVDEAVTLRLPTDIIIQEVADALNSLTYVAGELAPTRPPTYAFLKILLEAPGYSLNIEGFQEQVLLETKELANMADSGRGLSSVTHNKIASSNILCRIFIVPRFSFLIPHFLFLI
ncbi:MAG: hypothetical protein PVH61_30440 [Candidatus Aminicenantes bacterium]|jgi:hypothetical protein